MYEQVGYEFNSTRIYIGISTYFEEIPTRK